MKREYFVFALARQVQIADFAHAPLNGVLALLDRGLGNRLSVAVGLKLGEIQPLQKIDVKNLRAVKGATGDGGGEPGERRRVHIGWLHRLGLLKALIRTAGSSLK